MPRFYLALDQLSSWAAPGGVLRRSRLAVIMLLAYGLFALSYLSINLHSVGRPAHTLFLPGEARIPFVPAFEYLYVLGYGLPLLAVLRLPDARSLRRLLFSLTLTLVVAYATYLFFPVYFERPPLVVDSVATFLLWLEYHDPSYNHFPSLHVAVSWLIYLAVRDGCRWWGVLLAVVIGIAVSTVFVKQHYLVDVGYGMVLSFVAWRVSGRFETMRRI
jgi:membrane-associated phospholipid phosphatase